MSAQGMMVGWLGTHEAEAPVKRTIDIDCDLEYFDIQILCLRF